MGLEEVLARELQALGAEEVRAGSRVVTCRGDLRFVYRANLQLRTALRVLINLEEFEANNEQALYDRLRAINWRKWMLPEGSLYIDVVDTVRWFRNAHYIAQLAKDAIVDQFRQKYDQRPTVDKRDPDLRLHLLIGRGGRVTLSVDSSGAGLHRRGYRRKTGEAPINEVLAAGMLALAEFEGERPFVDPMCGSGTILAEAASIAAQQAPGLWRPFGFERWPDFDAAEWGSIRQEAIDQRRPPPYPILGADIDGVAIAISKATLERARLLPYVELRESPFAALQPPQILYKKETTAGLLVTNPPYEIRLRTGDITDLYRSIGDTLKSNWPGYTAWLISANPQAVKSVGLKTSRKIPLMNGPVEARFCRYDLYVGSKKESKKKTLDE